MLHPPPDKSIMFSQSKSIQKSLYNVDNRSVCDIMDQICKDTDLSPYVKQQKSKRDGRGAFYAIYFRRLGLNHVNVTASEAKSVLQTSMYDGKKKEWNCKKYIA